MAVYSTVVKACIVVCLAMVIFATANGCERSEEKACIGDWNCGDGKRCLLNGVPHDGRVLGLGSNGKTRISDAYFRICKPPRTVKGNWGSWQQAEPCSKSCGGGYAEHRRTCSNPPGASSRYGDIPQCSNPNTAKSLLSCNNGPCPVDGSLSTWGRWGACSTTCGGGSRERSRHCVSPQYGGRMCSRPRSLKSTSQCNTNQCPVDGSLSTWGRWGACSTTCGGGSRERSRHCVPPQYGGRICSRWLKSTSQCNTNQCPVDGFLSTWSGWGACSATCGGGLRQRSRHCVPPQYGGRMCSRWLKSTSQCNTNQCPAPEKCYSCHSGGLGLRQFPDCLPNGNMTDLARENFVVCQAPCVTRVNRWPLGDVIRGCSSMFHMAQEAPATGCVTLDDGSTTCYCSGPWCNDDDMTGERDKIIDKYA